MAEHDESVQSALEKVGQAVGKARMRRAALAREKARAEFLEVSAPMRSKVMGSLRDKIKSGMLADPDMWPCLRSAANDVLEQMLVDIEKEIERSLQAAAREQQKDADTPGPSGGRLSLWYRFRAFALHRYLPHDKYFFGKLKDPVYLLIYIGTLVPIHGVRICMFALLLLMLVAPGKPDEFQLINFILLCKGMQFLTSGLIQLAVGAGKYFACYSFAKGEMLDCVNLHGPGAGDGGGLLVDYLGSITLVWVAFSQLKRSEKHGRDKDPRLLTVEEAERVQQAGGRLRSLLDYDRRCFIVTVLLLVSFTTWTCWEHFEATGVGFRRLFNHPQFNANIFWCCVIYSILSVPFFPFMISGLQEVMTHCYATGYNKHGACVSFEVPSMLEAEESPVVPSAGYDFATYAGPATSILNAINTGRQLRGATDNEVLENLLGDLSRGIWARLTGAVPEEDCPAAGQP